MRQGERDNEIVVARGCMIFQAPYRCIPAGNLALHFHPDHFADLRASGLTHETIRASGVYSIRPCDIALFFRRGKVPEEVQSALCFPYQDPTFARIKLFPKVGKRKYSQPPDTSARLYLPIPVEEGPVYVCEGEKKTLAARQAGLNAVGIGGLWNWLTKGEPIEDLSLLTWERDVALIPDSDVVRRADLLRAVYALGRELRNRGASVSVAQIPERGAGKVGLDDFLAVGGEVGDLVTLVLGSRAFRSAHFWYGRWKLSKGLQAA
jgi:putative DNA primase/helicase